MGTRQHANTAGDIQAEITRRTNERVAVHVRKDMERMKARIAALQREYDVYAEMLRTLTGEGA